MTRPQALAVVAGTLLAVFLADSVVSAQTAGCCPSWQGVCKLGNDYRRVFGSGMPRAATGSYAASLVQREIARKMALGNSKLAVEVYFERKLSNIDYRGQLKVARIRSRYETQAQIASLKSQYADVIAANRRRAEELARRLAPDRLAPGEYDTATGSILWPPLLCEDERFAGDRARLDVLFALRTPSNSGLVSRDHLQVRQVVNRMKDTLMAMQHELDGDTYVAVKRLLESVAYEARFPAQPAFAKIAAN